LGELQNENKRKYAGQAWKATNWKRTSHGLLTSGGHRSDKSNGNKQGKNRGKEGRGFGKRREAHRQEKSEIFSGVVQGRGIELLSVFCPLWLVEQGGGPELFS
jgi:hypothetical protein